MGLHIASALRSLRRGRDVTQEELGEAIGVSAQAVSKWERSEGYPDITLLPRIAGFFGVTIDEVCGMDAQREEEEVQKIIYDAWEQHENEQIAAILRDGLKEHPDSFELKAELAYILTAFTGEQKLLDESVKLFEEILDRCTNEKIRATTRANICTAYERAGYHDKAKQAADALPNLYKTREVELISLLDGVERIDEIQNAVQEWVWCFYFWVREACKTEHYTTSEKIALWQKVVAVYDAVYEEHDHCFALKRVLWAEKSIARLAAEVGDAELCLASLGNGAEIALRHDTMEIPAMHTSLLINRVAGTYMRRGGEELPNMRAMLNEAVFDFVRETKEFRGIEAALA